MIGRSVLFTVKKYISSNPILSPTKVCLVGSGRNVQENDSKRFPVCTYWNRKHFDAFFFAPKPQTTSVKILYYSETLISLTWTWTQWQVLSHSSLTFATFSLSSIWSSLSPLLPTLQAIYLMWYDTYEYCHYQVITPLPCGLSSDHHLVHFTLLTDNLQLSHMENFHSVLRFDLEANLAIYIYIYLIGNSFENLNMAAE